MNRKKVKMVILFMLLFFETPFLAGCWDSIDAEELGVAMMMGIGLSNNGLKVIIQEKPHEKEIQGQSSSSSKSPFLIYTGSGSTISEAISRMSAYQHHKIYFAHMKVVILDEDLVRTIGIKPVIDFCERNPQIRNAVWILISHKNQLEKTISTDVGLNTDTGTILGETISHEKEYSFFSANNIKDIADMLDSPGNEIFTAGVRLTNSNGSSGSGKNSFSDKKFNIAEAAVFKECKMVGWLNSEEYRGLAYINNSVGGGISTLHCENGDVSLKIVKANTKLQPVIKDGKKRMIVNVRIKADITESQLKLSFIDKNAITAIEKKENEKVQKEIAAAVTKSKDLSSDFLGLGSYYSIKYPSFWKQSEKQWPAYLRDIEVDIYVDTIIRNVGKIYGSIKNVN